MSRHHIMPPVTYAPPPPKKIEKKKPRLGVGALSEFDEMEEAREADGAMAPLANHLLPQNFPEIEDAISKARQAPGRLSQATLSALLRAQELK